MGAGRVSLPAGTAPMATGQSSPTGTREATAAAPGRRDPYAALARFVLRHRVAVLVLASLFVVGGGWWSRDVTSHLSSGGFHDPASDSAQVARLMGDDFAARNTNLVLLVTAHEGSVDSPEVVTQGRLITAVVGQLPGVRHVASYWDPAGAGAPRSEDGRRALVLAAIPGDDDTVTRALAGIEERLQFDGSVVDVALGGPGQVFREIAERVEDDLRRAELLAFPLTGLLLLLVFATPVAAALPLVMGAVSVIGTVVVLRTAAGLTDVSVFALNLATGLGLGLAIDYALFMLARFRAEREDGADVDRAVQTMLVTAGRSVSVSGLTVAASLVVLLLFPLDFLRSFAYAGIAVAVLAVVSALVLLPALVVLTAPWLDRWPVRRRRRPGRSVWGLMAEYSMRHPVAVLGSCLVLLGLLAAPFLGVRLALPDERVLPTTAESREVQAVLQAEFPDLAPEPVQVVVPAGDAGVDAAALDQYATRLSRLPSVVAVAAVTGGYAGGARVLEPGPWSQPYLSRTGALVTVTPDVPAMSSAGQQLVSAVRSEARPQAGASTRGAAAGAGMAAHVMVGGRAAQLTDVRRALEDRLPLALALVAATTLVVLLLMFRAVAVPVKAVVLNVLSLSATFGAMVWVFQEGHLSETLGFTPTGALDVTVPVLMFCMAFGLSMDYEVFLMSSVKEEYDRSGDPRASVVAGLSRTGGLVTSLAAIIATVFICFATSGVTFIKLMGIGLAMAVILDATVIRGLLAPSMMSLAGRANWWAPRWLQRRPTPES